MTIQEALTKAIPTLPKSSPRLDAEVLLSWVLKQRREYILAHPEKNLTKLQRQKYQQLIKRRNKHEPVAYLVGHQAFYDLDFLVDKHVLIPRPETELMIDQIKKLPANKRAIIDLGTGSGCIIITLAKHGLGKQYLAVDFSAPALKVAKQNAKKYRQNKTIAFYQGDLLLPIINNLKTKRIKLNSPEIIITANLPYLTPTESSGLKYEPQIALLAGADGLKYYRRLAKQLIQFQKLVPNKKLIILCEIGHAQTKKFKQIFQKAEKITIHKDLAKLNRLATVYILN